jgi:hypothetical protein
MNEMNELETRLRSWAPRRPSANIERRLFAARPPRAGSTAWPGWLSAAAACLLFALAATGRLDDFKGGSQSVEQGPFVAMILSNQSYAAFLPGSFQPEHNRFRADSFEWTNASSSTSSMGSLSPMKVNN